MTSIELTAPAKVNLYLKVLNKRRDSYHNLITVFERITLADRIKISKIPNGIVVSCDKPITSDPKDNLVYKAARMILGYKGIKSGVEIAINKNIPIAGGLGGGSSDAAAVLIGLNKLFALDIATNTLLRLGAKIGADVPFFILETKFALGQLKGEKLKKIASKNRFWHLIICPDFHVAAKDVYKAFDSNLSRYLTKNAGDVRIHPLLQIPMDFDTAESMLSNDLEDVVASKRNVIGKIIKRLAHSLGKKAIVSGSGPSVFCLYRTRKEALTAKRRFLGSVPATERKTWRIFVAETY